MPIMKLAGHLPLQDMIAQTIDTARAQMSASSEKRASAAPAGRRAPVKTKVAGPVIDFSDPDQIEKLASALESVGDDLIKEADSIENGGESHQGGMQLPTNTITPGRQSYNRDGSKRHSVPMSTGMQSSSDGGGATQMPNDANKAPGGPPMPAKGVFKTAAQGVFERIEQTKLAKSMPPSFAENAGKVVAAQDPKKPGAEKPDLGAPGKKKKDEDEDEDDKEKKSSASFDFLLSKLSESAQGGETLDSASGSGPKPPSNPGREYIESNSAATNMKKVDGKAPQKRLLSEVLTEPALSKSTDSKVQDNLRNASKGGVKIAAARAFLQKIASDPSDPRHEKLKEAFAKAKEKKAIGGMGTSPMSSGGLPPPSAGM